MARPVRIQIKQLKELQQALKNGESAMDPKVISDLIARALGLIQQRALANIRTLFKTKTGNLEKSLITKISRKTLRGRFGAWTKAGGKLARHAHMLEFGHRIVGHRPGKTDTGKHTPARPFFRPALDAERKNVRRMIRQGLQELCAKGFGFGKPGDATE